MDDNANFNPAERRIGERSKVAFRASVSSHLDINGLSCLVRDATQYGCRIVSSFVGDLPDDVLLTIDGVSKPIKGRIVWRKPKEAGVEFLLENPLEILERRLVPR